MLIKTMSSRNPKFRPLEFVFQPVLAGIPIKRRQLLSPCSSIFLAVCCCNLSTSLREKWDVKPLLTCPFNMKSMCQNKHLLGVDHQNEQYSMLNLQKARQTCRLVVNSRRRSRVYQFVEFLIDWNSWFYFTLVPTERNISTARGRPNDAFSRDLISYTANSSYQ